jgi:hypothetical protein
VGYLNFENENHCPDRSFQTRGKHDDNDNSREIEQSIHFDSQGKGIGDSSDGPLSFDEEPTCCKEE